VLGERKLRHDTVEEGSALRELGCRQELVCTQVVQGSRQVPVPVLELLRGNVLKGQGRMLVLVVQSALRVQVRRLEGQSMLMALVHMLEEGRHRGLIQGRRQGVRMVRRPVEA